MSGTPRQISTYILIGMVAIRKPESVPTAHTTPTKIEQTMLTIDSSIVTSAPFSKVQSNSDRFRLEAIYRPTKNLTARVLAQGLDILGIETVPNM